MKKVMITLVMLFTSVNLMAQQQTLMGGNLKSGGFGGPVVKFSRVQDDFAVFAGARGGWIINKTLTLGAGVYGLANPVYLNGAEQYRIDMNYGGFELGVILSSDQLVHLSFHTLIGGGGFSVIEKEYFYDEHKMDDAFFVLEPSVGVTLNVFNSFRIEAGGSYRYISGVQDVDLSNSDFSGFSAHITFKFGKFD